MKRLVSLIAVIVLCVWGTKWLESQSTAQIVYTEPGLGEVNQSQAALNYAQAAKIDQSVRRQNEMDNGLSLNTLARIVTGQAITPAESIGTTAAVFGAILCLAPWLALLGLYVIYRLTKPIVTHE